MPVHHGKHPKTTLKVERDGGVQVIHCRKEDLDYESGNGLCICIPDFRGQTDDPNRNVIYIEWYDGKLQVRVYDGEEEAGICHINKTPDPALTHALYCPLTELPKLLSSEDEIVKEIVERRLKENK
jgi:hypothetical protein